MQLGEPLGEDLFQVVQRPPLQQHVPVGAGNLALLGLETGTVAQQRHATARAWQAGFRIVEVPIRFVERTAGVSKMSRDVVQEALVRITVWGLRSRRGRRKLSGTVTQASR